MNVKVSRSALENTIKMLMEADPPSEPQPPAPPSTTPTGTPAESPPAGPAEAPPVKKSLEQLFKEKVDSLDKMPNGATYATAGAKFEKKSGSWYMASAGGRTGLDEDQLLSLVREDQVAAVKEKIEADKKRGGTVGVTIQGSQFEPATTRSATFQLDNGYWKDMTPVPVQILAQYDFQEKEGLDPSETATYAAVIGTTGQGPYIYTRDEITYMITKDGSLYILAEGNKDNMLEAARNLITKVDPAGRIASTGRSKLFSLRDRSAVEQLTSQLETLRKFLPGENNATPVRFDVAIKDLKGLGDLQKAIADRRTLMGKFVDLFGVDEIEMTFTITPYGPALMRAQVVGGRGSPIRRGAGGLTSDDITGLMGTGLFIESEPPRADVSTYIPDTSDRQILIGDAPLASGLQAIADTASAVAGVLSGGRRGGVTKGVEPVVLTPTTPSGVNVTGLNKLGVKLTQEDDTYQNSFADAYFLYSNGALKAKEAPQPGEAPPAPAAPAPAPVDPLEGVKEFLNKPIIDGAVYFKFNKSGEGEYEQEPADYIAQVNRRFTELYETIPEGYWKSREGEDKALGILYVGTADPKGDTDSNIKLSQSRAFTIRDKSKPDIGPDSPLKKSQLWHWALGESLWSENADTLTKLSDDQRKPLRMTRAFLVVIRAVEPNNPKTGVVLMSEQELIKANCKEYGLAKVRAAVPDIRLKESKTITRKTLENAERNLLERIRGEDKMKITLRQFRHMIREELSKEEDLPKPERLLEKNPKPDTDEDRVDESQRGNDENSQHDNDTEPGDPMLKRLKEAALRDLRLADKILRRR